ncbi:hypothetical protein LUZ60_010922 [Juncus effusus]|nr:hypothetical protein LUZ60_010922 [Juncus effusus]
MEMDQEQQKDSSPSAPANTGASRWNPTKEQIAMLESLYKQGVRTPSAEQIQHITGKLREFGTIEGKNVFYWFQNHKARQRQKQKQQSFAYYTRLLRKSPPMVSPAPLPLNPSFRPPMACNNGVIYKPFFIPQTGDVNYYTQVQPKAQYQTIIFPETFNRSISNPGFPPSEQTENIIPRFSFPCNNNDGNNSVAMGRETLQLFPLHPSDRNVDQKSTSVSSSVELSENGIEGEEEVGNQKQFLIDFLGAALNGSN